MYVGKCSWPHSFSLWNHAPRQPIKEQRSSRSSGQDTATPTKTQASSLPISTLPSKPVRLKCHQPPLWHLGLLHSFHICSGQRLSPLAKAPQNKHHPLYLHPWRPCPTLSKSPLFLLKFFMPLYLLVYGVYYCLFT